MFGQTHGIGERSSGFVRKLDCKGTTSFHVARKRLRELPEPSRAEHPVSASLVDRPFHAADERANAIDDFRHQRLVLSHETPYDVRWTQGAGVTDASPPLDLTNVIE
jgi:hypothetical protein